MKNIYTYLFLIMITQLSAFSALAANNEQIKKAPIAAPNWSLKTQSGENISLSQYKGQPVILHFWATWCPYCKKIQPTLERLPSLYSEKHPEKKVVLIGISFNEDEGTQPQDTLTSRGHKFITAVEGEKIASLYGVRGTPTTFFINAEGYVVYATSTSNPEDPKLLNAFHLMIK